MAFGRPCRVITARMHAEKEDFEDYEFQKSGGHRGTTAAPDKGRQLRGMGGADGLNPSNSGLRLAFPA